MQDNLDQDSKRVLKLQKKRNRLLFKVENILTGELLRKYKKDLKEVENELNILINGK